MEGQSVRDRSRSILMLTLLGVPSTLWSQFCTLKLLGMVENAEMEDAAIQCPVSSHKHIPFTLPVLLLPAEGLCLVTYLPLACPRHTRDGYS